MPDMQPTTSARRRALLILLAAGLVAFTTAACWNIRQRLIRLKPPAFPAKH